MANAQPVFCIVPTLKRLPVSKVGLHARTVFVNQLSAVDGVVQASVHEPPSLRSAYRPTLQRSLLVLAGPSEP